MIASQACAARDDEAWPNTLRAARFIPAVEYINANRMRTQLMQDMAQIMRDIDVFCRAQFRRQCPAHHQLHRASDCRRNPMVSATGIRRPASHSSAVCTRKRKPCLSPKPIKTGLTGICSIPTWMTDIGLTMNTARGDSASRPLICSDGKRELLKKLLNFIANAFIIIALIKIGEQLAAIQFHRLPQCPGGMPRALMRLAS